MAFSSFVYCTQEWTLRCTYDPSEPIASNGDLYVAVGDGGIIARSSDGNRWGEASFSATENWLQDIAWGGGRFVAAGWGGNGRVGTVVYSTDGDRWELADDHEYLTDGHFEAIAWSGERFVAVSYFNGTIMYSRDGDHWEQASEIATYDLLRDVTWGAGHFVAVGWNGTIVVSP